MKRWAISATLVSYCLLLLISCSGKQTATSAPISVAIGPTPVTLAGGASQIFAAAVINDASNAGVTWSIGAGPGTLTATSATGTTYTAPSGLTVATTVALTATSITDSTKSAAATITVSPSSLVSVSVSPTPVTLASSATQKFTAVVTGDVGSAGVTWSLSGPGTLTSVTTTTVIYNAPAGLPAAGSATVTATSKTDTTKSAPVAITLSAPAGPASAWVYYNSSGNLVYKTLTNADNAGADGQDQIMDFSTAGYMQGGTAIPTATVQATVSASGDTTGAHDTANIQNAINTVAAMTLNTATGLRGAVLLNAGTYYVNASLQIAASGVVLRGAGSGTSATTNTILNMVAASMPYPLVVLGTSGTSPTLTGTATAITDAYVPAGATTLDVASTTGLATGSTVIIQRPVTQTWINFMGMNAATAPIDNCSSTPCNWISAGNSGLMTDRTITAVSGNKITLDAPMSDSIDSTYTGVNGATVQPYTFSSRISQVGVENLRAVAPVPATSLVPPTPSYQLLETYSVLNAWARNLTAQDTLQSVVIDKNSKQVTVLNVAITHTVTQTDSAKFMEFYIQSATQVLMDTVSDTADNMFFFSTSSTTQGPNVLRNGTFFGNDTIEPHQRWATGLLVENTTVAAGPSTSGGISFYSRGDYGSGHGWTIGWGVAWNTTVAGSDIFQQPPGSQNWCIGCIGTQVKQAAPGGSTVLTQGAIDSSGTYVFPASLYQAQLTQRLGPGVVAQ